MNILRLLLFVFLGLMVRRVYLSVKASLSSAGSRSGGRGPASPDEGPAGANSEMKDLTEQDISDADFEEIP